ncbi:M48 family peptidase [Actinobacteria bacterium YIM 96077]|uniref:Peptidase M48 n=1 Tax=Phytoactinopolyspora halophila TaxID=1981511 RepID=A0A329QKG2_9ACTN|nr:M48 family metallopeptidase [Phytoactinopolyspora halophila]AYY13563.1 M48 family peptidase [Actinobacteria bacterium YIM 96077]RAW12381.1 peptidase M48 [Phytoactinopolyspora halophila]
MATTPDRTRVRFPDISARAYEHPADRGALVALRSLRGFDTVLKKMAGLFSERALRLHFLSGTVRVGETQFADVHQDVVDAAHILDLSQVPDLYVMLDPQPRAMAIGKDRPFIVVSTGMFDMLDAEERRFVVGHEVGHILSGHAIYRTLLLALTNLATRVAWLPLGYFGLRAIVLALEEWQRKSELSCDRAGLLTLQDPDAAKRTLMKLAGGSRLAQMDVDAFHEQAREYDAAEDARDGLLKLLSLIGRSHPQAVVRLAELDHWASSGEYSRILAGDYPRRSEDQDASISQEARNAAKSYQESWNRSADPLIKVLRDVAGGAQDAGSKIFDSVFGRRSS